MTTTRHDSAHPDMATLAAYLDGNLSDADTSAVREHLVTCADCMEIVTESAVALDELLPDEGGEVVAFPRRWMAIAIAAAIIVPLLALALILSMRGDSPDELGQLAALAPGERLIEPRLSIDTWAPLAAVTRGTSERSRNVALLEKAAELERRDDDGASAETLHLLGVVQLMLGESLRAEATLEDARARAGADEALIVDHVAALVQNGVERGDRERLERAVRIVRTELPQPLSSAAQFNLALALEGLGERNAAIEAWQAYLSEDASSEWAAEARTHLQRLESR